MYLRRVVVGCSGGGGGGGSGSGGRQLVEVVICQLGHCCQFVLYDQSNASQPS